MIKEVGEASKAKSSHHTSGGLKADGPNRTEQPQPSITHGGRAAALYINAIS